jgi:hypothetical protein
MSGMRRAPVIFLIALFSFSLIAPAIFAVDPYAKLPACCRRAGKHHCELMQQEAASSSGPALDTGTCSLFPQTKAGPSGLASSVAGVPQPAALLPASHRSPQPATDSLSHSSYSRAGQKRGPPPTIA